MKSNHAFVRSPGNGRTTLVALTSEYRVKKIICKTLTGTLANNADPDQTLVPNIDSLPNRDSNTVVPFNDVTHVSRLVTLLFSVELVDTRNTASKASVAQLDAPSDWRPGGRGFNPRRDWQHSFVEIDHEIFSTVILSLPLIQEGSCQFLAKECAQYWLTV